MKKYNVAVVGATGVVGNEMIKMLETRNFPVENIKLLASERSVGKKLKFNSKDVSVELLTHDSGKDIDIALFSAGASTSREFAPSFAKYGAFVIDNSSEWRMNENCPLVVPEVNPDDLKKDKKIIANPNCSTIQMVVALKPIHNYAKIKRVIVSTYQAVSGAGIKGIHDLENQTKKIANNEKIDQNTFEKFPYQIARNLIPHIDVFMENGYTKEEMKMTNETKKIMGDNNILVSATCVRVPVLRAHSEAVWIETEKEVSPEKARELLKNAKGIEVIDDTANQKYPMPLFAECQQKTFVGRIRKDITLKNGLTFWVVSDNLLKGAALNAVEIAETLIKKDIL